MKLYYSPGACSLSPHIALLEAGLPYDLVKVDLKAKKLENGDDYLKVNPKGQVPALALDSGELVTEGPVIVQMIADKAAAKNLAPARDSAERYKLQEWLTYINSELHKNIGPMFSPVLTDDAKNFFKDRAISKFGYVDGAVGGQGLPDGQAIHRRRRLSVHDAGLGRSHEVRPFGAIEPEGLPGPRRGAADGAAGADQGRPDEGGVRFLRIATSKRAGSMIRPFFC